MGELIDTTEMYLRTLFELQEDGIRPLRARIAERLGQSGPTVSQTVARMERDGLLTVQPDRTVELTASGRTAAARVMRKHRLAERLLVDVIGLPWAQVHAEACRWEHVISEAVESRLYALLGAPQTSPFGNPIPGLGELDPNWVGEAGPSPRPAAELAGEAPVGAQVVRIAEPLQDDLQVLARLAETGALPGAVVKVRQAPDGVEVIGSAGSVVLSAEQAWSLQLGPALQD